MTSLKAPLGFAADFLKSGAQSRRGGERESRTSLILWFYEVAMTSGLPASDRTNDISNSLLSMSNSALERSIMIAVAVT
jgi:hypothetical protein